jgi:hypothetical protein
MNQEFSYSTFTTGADLQASSSLKAYADPAKSRFYAQSSGSENQFQLLVYGLTGTPVLSIPAVTFTSDRFYLVLRPQTPGGFTVHRAQGGR